MSFRRLPFPGVRVARIAFHGCDLPELRPVERRPDGVQFPAGGVPGLQAHGDEPLRSDDAACGLRALQGGVRQFRAGALAFRGAQSGSHAGVILLTVNEVQVKLITDGT